jgi:hypothetical protein
MRGVAHADPTPFVWQMMPPWEATYRASFASFGGIPAEAAVGMSNANVTASAVMVAFTMSSLQERPEHERRGWL